MMKSRYLRWPRWGSFSHEALEEAEMQILSVVTVPYEGEFIDLGPIIDEFSSTVWTIIFNKNAQTEKLPIVLVHGLGAGVALWAKNLNTLASDRTVYAFDLLGFARSSRTVFSTDPLQAERQLVLSIEEWTKKLGLQTFVLVGHSLGGFLVTSYALEHPEKIAHLVLADPWGFNQQPTDLNALTNIPLHHRVIVRVMEPLNPLWTIRAAGPLAIRFIQKVRADLIRQFEGFLADPASKIANYIYHCNAQRPTGEEAFHAMMVKFGWAKHPMYLRLPQLKPDIHTTVIYGAQTWVDHYPIDKIQEMRPGRITFHTLDRAGHHVYADMAEDFNRIILEACEFCETPEESSTTMNESVSVMDSTDETIYSEVDQREHGEEPDVSGSVTVVYTGRHMKETFTTLKSDS